MKIQCEVCEKGPATVICCADEAALCGQCDIAVHSANKLASKHQRLLLSTNLPSCDICQEKPAFIFCVEDRALFCQDCDESLHSAATLSANHLRLLSTGIRLDGQMRPNQHVAVKMQTPSFASQWTVDHLLKKKEKLQFGELQWLAADMNDQLPEAALSAAQVPHLPIPQFSKCDYTPPTGSPNPEITMKNSSQSQIFAEPNHCINNTHNSILKRPESFPYSICISRNE